jgi:hypothetical protein
VARTPEQFARQMATLGARMERNVADSVGKAAQVVKGSVEAQMRSAVGNDLRMSGVGRSGARIGVRYDVKGSRNPTAFLRATGPVQLVERDTIAHTILPRSVGRAQGRSKAARRAAKQDLYNALFGASVGSGATPLKIGGDRFAYRVKHPGTKGKHPFEKGVDRAAPAAQKILAGACTKSLAEVFR